MHEEITDLSARVARLEREVGHLRTRLGVDLPPAAPPRVLRHPPPGAAPPPYAPPPYRHPIRRRRAHVPRDTDASEVDFVATWFSRLGVLAILLGAAFAFGYAIDQGWIGPWGRVLTGMLAGIGFIAWSEVTLRRRWHRLSQALGAGGVAMMYLSVWVAGRLYELIAEPTTFLALIGVTGVCVGLALRHDSMPLAILATAGAFVNPIVAGGTGGASQLLFVYLIAVDTGVAVLAAVRRWNTLDAVAFGGTWALTLMGLEGASDGSFLFFATTFALFFAALPLVRSFIEQSEERRSDLVIGLLNAALYFPVLVETTHQRRGAAIVLAALVYAGFGAMALAKRTRADALVHGYLLAALGYVTLLVPLELPVEWVAPAWGAEAVGLTLIALRPGAELARRLALGLFGLSLAWIMGAHAAGLLTVGYEPASLEVSAATLALAGFLYAGAYAARRADDGDASRALSLGAHLVTLGWLSVEARALSASATATDLEQRIQFAYTAVWGIYGAALLGVGVARRMRSVRQLGFWMVCGTGVKVVLVDLWLVDTVLRVASFMVLGVVLLSGSLLYHRWRDLILGDRTDA